MELTTALDFARQHRHGTIVTTRKDGRPQLSIVIYDLLDSGVFRISITTDRSKYRNLRRDPWAALHIARNDFYAYVVLEGAVELTEPAGAPDDAVADELVEYYRRLSGEHPDWDDYRKAMVAEHRLVARFTATRAYGMA
jgi:PPOX class probable F420-dependent enzyme